jgi:hypothetical protein
VVVDDTTADLETIQRELIKRSGGDYEVVGDTSPEAALQRLEVLRRLPVPLARATALKAASLT